MFFLDSIHVATAPMESTCTGNERHAVDAHGTTVTRADGGSLRSSRVGGLPA